MGCLCTFNGFVPDLGGDGFRIFEGFVLDLDEKAYGLFIGLYRMWVRRFTDCLRVCTGCGCEGLRMVYGFVPDVGEKVYGLFTGSAGCG